MTTTAIKMAAQGDVLFERVDDDTIPDGFTTTGCDGPIIVAHSETGHHHTVSGVLASLYSYRADPMTSYLRLRGDHVDVDHHRHYDQHDTIRLLGGAGAVWRVRRQREHTPEGWRRVED